MRVMFTGEAGQLARVISSHLESGEVVEADANRRTRCSTHHRWPELDVTDPGELLYSFERARPDVVVHAAAVVGTDKCEVHPRRCVDVNLTGTHNVLEACARVGAKLLYVSTTATYDPTRTVQRPFSERSPQRPPTLYGITKYAGELLVSGQQRVPNLIVRPCFIFGDPPHDHSSMLCRVAVHQAVRELYPEATGTTPVILMDPKALKDYVRVEDFARAMVSILRLEEWDGDVFNVSAMNARPVGEFFNMVAEEFGTELDASWRPTMDYMGDHVVSSEKLRACTGWAPQVPVREGVRTLVSRARAYARTCREKSQATLY